MSDSKGKQPHPAPSNPVWEGLAAIVSGIGNIPLDAIRYPGLGANWGMNKVGLRDDETAQSAADAINFFADNPPFLSDALNAERRRLAEAHPWKTMAGEIGSGLGLAKLALKKGVNIAPKNGKQHSYKNRITGSEVYSAPTYFGGAAAAATADELLVEDLKQELAKIRSTSGEIE